MLEMYRRDSIRQDLLLERCRDLMALDDRLGELETLLAASLSRGHVREAVHCECGAPVFWRARYCAQCGRALQSDR